MEETERPLDVMASEKKPPQQHSTSEFKMVSFHPSVDHQTTRSVHSKIYSYVSEGGWESRESNTGYSHERQGDCEEGVQHGYFRRLYRFYEHYNPEKLDSVEKYLSAYKGKEEQLFAILVGKYGSEPPVAPTQSANSICSSENASVIHYAGKRYRIPTTVSPQQGNTECETPYWGGPNLISERDILGLLSNLDTTNEELQKCYIGLCAQHPTSSWNGMTYITRADEVAATDTEFLGHLWAGNLSSKRSMVCDGAVYHRVVLYCTEECQSRWHHERWRLSIYKNSANSLNLIRVVWDPVICLEPLPVSHSAVSTCTSSEAVNLMRSSASRFGSRGGIDAEPKQPLVSTTLMDILKSIGRLEANICGRLDALETRLSSLESRLDAAGGVSPA